MQHFKWSLWEGPWIANVSALSVDCQCREVKKSQWFLFIHIHTHFCCGLICLDFVFCFFSSQCLSPGFLSGCSLPCVGDELARHNAWLRNVALSVSRPAVAKWWQVCQSQHLSLVSAADEESLASPAPIHLATTCTSGQTGPWDSQGSAKAAKGKEKVGWNHALCWELGLWPLVWPQWKKKKVLSVFQLAQISQAASVLHQSTTFLLLMQLASPCCVQHKHKQGLSTELCSPKLLLCSVFISFTAACSDSGLHAHKY